MSHPARLVLAAALAVLLAAGGSGCRRHAAPAPSSDDARIPDQEARDFTLTESAAGKKNWTLLADYAAMFNRERKVDAKKVTIYFFDKAESLYSTLTADRGEIDQTTNDLEAKGRVRVTTKNGVLMETDSLRFFNRTGKIASDGFVRVTRHGDVLTGYGFESDATLEHFRLVREVRAEVRSAAAEDSIGP